MQRPKALCYNSSEATNLSPNRVRGKSPFSSRVFSLRRPSKIDLLAVLSSIRGPGRKRSNFLSSDVKRGDTRCRLKIPNPAAQHSQHAPVSNIGLCCELCHVHMIGWDGATVMTRYSCRIRLHDKLQWLTLETAGNLKVMEVPTRPRAFTGDSSEKV